MILRIRIVSIDNQRHLQNIANIYKRIEDIEGRIKI